MTVPDESQSVVDQRALCHKHLVPKLSFHPFQCCNSAPRFAPRLREIAPLGCVLFADLPERSGQSSEIHLCTRLVRTGWEQSEQALARQLDARPKLRLRCSALRLTKFV